VERCLLKRPEGPVRIGRLVTAQAIRALERVSRPARSAKLPRREFIFAIRECLPTMAVA